VQGSSHVDRELLDAQMLVGHLVPAGSVFAFLAEHRRRIFPDDAFADLFPSPTGRPSIPAEVIGSVLVLQTLQDLSDRETAQALRCDLRPKVACGLSLTDEGFDPSTLVYWRRRLAASQEPNRIFEAVTQLVEATGVGKGRRHQALDSTILADAVATEDTITQLIAAIRRLARQVPGAAEHIAAQCSGHDYSTPGKPKIDWDDPAARDGLVSALVNDANLLVTTFKDAKLTDKQAQAVALLALVAGQDVEPAEDLRRHRWALAHRPPGGHRPGDLHGGSPDAAHPQEPGGAPRRLPRPYRARTPDRVDHRGCADQGQRRGGQRRRRRRAALGRPGRTGGSLWRCGLWHRGPTRRLGGGRTYCGPQSQAAPSLPWTAGSPWMRSPSMRAPPPSPVLRA
jgi:hypothetical protein